MNPFKLVLDSIRDVVKAKPWALKNFWLLPTLYFLFDLLFQLLSACTPTSSSVNIEPSIFFLSMLAGLATLLFLPLLYLVNSFFTFNLASLALNYFDSKQYAIRPSSIFLTKPISLGFRFFFLGFLTTIITVGMILVSLLGLLLLIVPGVVVFLYAIAFSTLVSVSFVANSGLGVFLSISRGFSLLNKNFFKCIYYAFAFLLFMIPLTGVLILISFLAKVDFYSCSFFRVLWVSLAYSGFATIYSTILILVISFVSAKFYLTLSTPTLENEQQS